MKLLFLLLLLVSVYAVEQWWPTRRNTNTTQQRLIFVKTHKTGSSTVSSILHRYCDEHEGVTCYTEGPIPRNAAVFSYTPEWFASTSFPQIDIYSNHLRYWPTLLHAFVPEPAPIITIVREPAARFLSGWDYARKKWRGQSDIFELVRHMPVELDQLPADFRELLFANSYEQSLCPSSPSWAIRNASEPSCIQTLRDIQRGVISLVMITERMDESLVLLGRVLGWSVEELVYRSMKNSSSSSTEQHDSPPQDIVRKLHGWLRDDVILYQAALRLFEARVSSQDTSFWVEVQQLKQKKLELRAACSHHLRRSSVDQTLCTRLSLDHADWIRLQTKKKDT